MIEITRKITLDLARKSNTRLIYATQNDLNSRRLSITLTDDGRQFFVPRDVEALINVKRPDLSQKAFRCEVCDDGTVTYTIDSWVLSGAGDVKCSISIISPNHQKLTSSEFILDVAPSLCTDNIISEDENYSILTELLADVKDANDNENARIIAEEQRVVAEVARVQAETQRQNSETQRKSAEDERLAAEHSRVLKDTQRNERLNNVEQVAQKNSKRISNLEQWVRFTSFETDDSIAYTKSIPASACPNAQISEIGGMTYSVPVTNMLAPPYYDASGTTHNGITYTVSEDGTVTANGTKLDSAAPSIFYISFSMELDLYQTYHFSGTPSTGSTTGHYMNVCNKKEVGNGVLISGETSFSCYIYIGEKSVTNLQFKPLLYAGDSLIPYSDLRKAKVTSIETGCGNLIPFPYYSPSQQLCGINFDIAEDGSICLTGESTLESGVSDYHIARGLKLPTGSYFISGSPKNGGTYSHRLLVNILRSDKTSSYISDTGAGATFEAHDDDIITVSIRVGRDLDLTNGLTFFPVISRGTSPKEFHARHDPTSIIVPAAVRHLEGYGDGINSEHYNKLIFDTESPDATFIQTVARRAYQSGDEELENVLTNGKETLYVLDTPRKTVIENCLGGGLIDIEPGGTITFKNSIEMATPSKVTYVLEEE